jgi:hypothetical protein
VVMGSLVDCVESAVAGTVLNTGWAT